MTEASQHPAVPGANRQEATGADDDDPGPSLSILIDDDNWRSFGGSESVVTRAHEAFERSLPEFVDRAVTVLLSSDAAIAALNAAYRGQEKPTNVLSFPLADIPFPDAPAPLGDIIIAYQTVMREAEAEHKEPLAHLAHLTVHGLLHLAGYGHDTDNEAERMEEMERTILADIGIPDPYQSVEDETPEPAN